MEVGNHEIIDKLKASVVAKLDELDSSKKHDSTLIDYILVMVVNQKNKYEMKHNLSLFLGKIVDDFVNWLFDFLNQLRLTNDMVEANNQENIENSSSASTKDSNVKNEIKNLLKSETDNKEKVEKISVKSKNSTHKRKLKSAISNKFNDEKDKNVESDIKKDLHKSKKRILTEDPNPQPVKKQNLSELPSQASQYRKVEIKDEFSKTTDEISKENETKFLVTLDGVKDMFKDNDNLFLLDEDFDPELMKEDISNAAPDPSLKTDVAVKENDISNKHEKCKYWPSCMNGDQCEFYHPVTKCNNFPYCRFGDKCLYIHPTCKFDLFCSRKDCPFVHTAKRAPLNAQVATCKYFPNCMKPSCDFFHPKMCHYGSSCKSFNCPYLHPQNTPHSSKFKWSSSKTNNTTFTISNKKEIEIK